MKLLRYGETLLQSLTISEGSLLTLRHVSAEIAKRDFVNQRGPSSRIASMRSAPDAQGKSIGIAGDIFRKPPQ